MKNNLINIKVNETLSLALKFIEWKEPKEKLKNKIDIKIVE